MLRIGLALPLLLCASLIAGCAPGSSTSPGRSGGSTPGISRTLVLIAGAEGDGFATKGLGTGAASGSRGARLTVFDHPEVQKIAAKYPNRPGLTTGYW